MGQAGKILSFNLKVLRKQRDWTQQDLAVATDLSVEYIKKIETDAGWVSSVSLAALAAAFEVPETRFFVDPQYSTPPHSLKDCLSAINEAILRPQAVTPAPEPAPKEESRAEEIYRRILELPDRDRNAIFVTIDNAEKRAAEQAKSERDARKKPSA